MKTRFSIFAVASSCAALCLAQVPEISDVSMTQDTASRLVTIHYTLSVAPAIVTVDICTNHVSIGDGNVTYLAGDVNKLITDLGTVRTVTWRPDKSWPDHKITGNAATVKVTAWATNAPPDYMVVNLNEGTNIQYYTSAVALPDGGLTNSAYRTTRIVLRKISAAGVTWTMGSYSENGRRDYSEAAHSVTLTNDYYIGIYELTQGQWARMENGSRPAYWNNESCWSERPEEYLSYTSVRGYGYPNDPSPDSFLGLLRARTGIAFDLPSEAQWEYACRAGNGEGKWGDGSTYTSSTECTNLNLLARYQNDGGRIAPDYTDAPQGTTAEHGPAIVGSYRPNSWGLYDMHGNLWEYCLDKYTADITQLNGAVNTNGDQWALRGGSWGDIAVNTRSAARPTGFTGANNGMGCRLAIVLP